MIVHYRHRPQRPSKPAQPAALAVPRIVQHTPRGMAWKPVVDDPEADARVAAFLARMVRSREQRNE
jgi:hypothetical protein